MTTRLISSTLAGLLSLTTACASLQPTPQVHIDPRLNVGNMGERSDFELRTWIFTMIRFASAADSSRFLR